MSAVLIVDDEQNIRSLLTEALSIHNYTPYSASTIQEGLQLLSQENIEAVLLDLRLPDGDGLDYLGHFLNAPCSPEVIVMTAYGDPQGAEQALTQGAFDFVQKPIAVQELLLILERALEYRFARLSQQKTSCLHRKGIIGNSQCLQEALQAVSKAASGEHNILLTGETGSGKELFARAIHENSPRSEHNFIVVDCGALTSSLAESTLFGHTKGAFTNAHQAREGLVAQAHQGTIFLDEIAELDLEIQKKLLRVIEEKTYLPVGGQKRKTSNFRLVAATNKDLKAMVEEKSFRSDLHFRICAQEIRIPPLRERKEDLPEIIEHYLQKICQNLKTAPKQYHPELLNFFTHYEWPGNVRELINTLKSTISAALNSSVLHRKHLPVSLRVSALKQHLPEENGNKSLFSTDITSFAPDSIPDWKAFKELALEEVEKKYFLQLLSITGNNIQEAARLAGLTKSRIYGILQKHGLKN